jgi:hypothetical protein
MEKGLLWLPLLAVFIALAWSGAREYQKVEAYRLWSESFDKAKYDIYAVLGLKGQIITWGKPTPKEPENLQSFSLEDVQEILLFVNGKSIDLEAIPRQGGAELEFRFKNASTPAVTIPFTEVALAAQWAKYLRLLFAS